MSRHHRLVAPEGFIEKQIGTMSKIYSKRLNSCSIYKVFLLSYLLLATKFKKKVGILTKHNHS